MAPPHELVLSDEVEGEYDGTTDFVFRLAGDPIPSLPPARCLQPPRRRLPRPPQRLLAANHQPTGRSAFPSRSHHLGFLTLFPGFMAVRTNALIEASKEAREKCKAGTRCAQECCVADVPLLGVSLLELSRDESVLAACAGSEIQFFSSASLLTDKDVGPSSSYSLGGSGTVRACLGTLISVLAGIHMDGPGI